MKITVKNKNRTWCQLTAYVCFCLGDILIIVSDRQNMFTHKSVGQLPPPPRHKPQIRRSTVKSPSISKALGLKATLSRTNKKLIKLMFLLIIIMLAYFCCAAYTRMKVNESSTLGDRLSHSQCTVRGIDGGWALYVLFGAM